MKRCTTIVPTIAAFAAAWISAVSSGQPMAPDSDVPPQEAGASVRLYMLDRGLDALANLIPGQTPNVAWIAPTISLSDGVAGSRVAEAADNFLVTVDGWIRIDAAGEYAFQLTSDDGSKMRLGERTRFIDNDGLHGPVGVPGKVELAPGLHRYEIQWFENSGGAELKLEWKRPGEVDWSIVPADVLSCRAGEVRVTAPGPKKVFRPLMRGRPGSGLPLDGVHPALTVVDLRPEGFECRVGGIDFLPDGRMIFCTWDDIGGVYVVDGATGRGPDDVTITRIAAGLAEPLGLSVVDGRIFVLQKQELTELVDNDGDGIIDEYVAVCSGWDVTTNFHEFAFGLVERNGLLYANLAIAIDPGGKSTEPQVPDRGTVIRIDPEDGTYEIHARGLRTPNGIGRGAGGDIYLTDNQGDWLPVSKVLPLVEGAFYGSRAVDGDAAAEWEVTPPVVWLPQNEIGNSPSEVAPLNVPPYVDQQVHGEVTHGGLKRVFVEEVDGVKQGAVFRFTQGLESGVNRVRVGPAPASNPGGHASFYVGGVGSTGNWGQTGKSWYGLQRLDWNGESAFEMLAIRARSNGFEIEFTTPVASRPGPDRFGFTRWWYEPTVAYGGPKIDVTRVDPVSVTWSDDGRVAMVEIASEELLDEHVYHVEILGGWTDVGGREPWTTEAWYTMNRVPRHHAGVVAPNSDSGRLVNALSEEEAAEGFRLLFDGETTDGWRNFRDNGIADGWQVMDGCLTMVGGGGDIVTEDVFGNFDLRLEWAIEAGGNSGIFWRVGEQGSAVWATGPEMQILDNERHADGQSPLTSAGSCYALIAPEYDDTLPPGRFNEARIVASGSRVMYWLNGRLQCSFDVDSPEWKALVAGSKFNGMRDFGRLAEGHIALQDHGDLVKFRSIRIREW